MFTFKRIAAVVVSIVLASGLGAGLAAASGSGPLPLHAGVKCSTKSGTSNVVFWGSNGTSKTVSFTIRTTISGHNTYRTLKVPAGKRLYSAALPYSGHFSLGFKVTASGMANPPAGSFTITCSALGFHN